MTHSPGLGAPLSAAVASNFFLARAQERMERAQRVRHGLLLRPPNHGRARPQARNRGTGRCPPRRPRRSPLPGGTPPCPADRARRLGLLPRRGPDRARGAAALRPPTKRRELTLRRDMSEATWATQALQSMDAACAAADEGRETPTPGKRALNRWFDSFVWLRNRTRAHGAPTGQKCAKVAAHLCDSVSLFMANYRTFQRPTAYLHRNLNGRYRVTPIAGPVDEFSSPKNEPDHAHADGVYIFFDEPRAVRLVSSDPDLSDLFVANGGFTERDHEFLSYLTDSRKRESSSPYLAPASTYPASETSGESGLRVLGSAFVNLPPRLAGYVSRPALERGIASRSPRRSESSHQSAWPWRNWEDLTSRGSPAPAS